MPGIPFERYADDIVCHCRTEREALALRQVLDRRFGECGLVLHPEKTKLVYCKDTNRKRDYGVIQFDFLGYTFRPRLAKWKGGLFGVSYLPAASPKALKAIRQAIRGWTLQTRSDKALDDLARMFNPYIRGWINYYSHFYKSALYPTLLRIDAFLLRWARRKFKRFRYAGCPAGYHRAESEGGGVGSVNAQTRKAESEGDGVGSVNAQTRKAESEGGSVGSVNAQTRKAEALAQMPCVENKL